MDPLFEDMLSDFSALRARMRPLEEELAEMKSEEEEYRRQALGYMVDNDLKEGYSADGLLKVSRKSGKKVELADKDALTAYLIGSRPDLVRPDLVAAKKEIGKDPAITGCFSVSYEDSLSVSEVPVRLDQTPVRITKTA